MLLSAPLSCSAEISLERCCTDAGCARGSGAPPGAAVLSCATCSSEPHTGISLMALNCFGFALAEPYRKQPETFPAKGSAAHWQAGHGSSTSAHFPLSNQVSPAEADGCAQQEAPLEPLCALPWLCLGRVWGFSPLQLVGFYVLLLPLFSL